MFLLYFWSNKCIFCEHKRLLWKMYRPQTSERYVLTSWSMSYPYCWAPMHMLPQWNLAKIWYLKIVSAYAVLKYSLRRQLTKYLNTVAVSQDSSISVLMTDCHGLVITVWCKKNLQNSTNNNQKLKPADWLKNDRWQMFQQFCSQKSVVRRTSVRIYMGLITIYYSQ